MNDESVSQDAPPLSNSAGASQIELHVNGESLRVTQPCTVAALLESLELGGKRVAVALNRDVVIRSRYPKVELAGGDRIEILEAVGGG